MKKILCVVAALCLLLSLSAASATGLVKGPPTPPPFARDEDGVVVVESTRAPIVTVAPTKKPASTAQPVDPNEPVLSGGALVDLGGVLYVDVLSGTTYARAKETPITVTANVSGGVKPYTLHFVAENSGTVVHDVTSTVSAAGAWVFTYQPVIGGRHTLEVSVTDASGEEVTDDVTVSVSEDAAEGRSLWKKSVSGVKLTGDWRVDLVGIAQTQIGYQESAADFIVDEEGVKHGYTRYGDWYGSKYGEWCSTFIAFCLEYAEVPKGLFPRAALVQELMDALDEMGAGEDYRYLPMVGDIVFFSTEGDYAPEHVGIIENVSGSSIYTIEGNSSDQVRRREYALDADEIVGYGNTTALMKKAGLIAEDEIEQTIEIPAEAIGVGYTMKADVNMRAEASSESRFVKRISDKGSEVSVLAADETGAEAWYFVQYKEHLGFVRGDLLQVTLLTDEVICTCGAFPDENGETVHTAACAVTLANVECTCGAEADENGVITHAVACAITLAQEPLSEEMLRWIEETNPSEEMIERAKRARSLDSIVLEEDAFIHVRSGETVAHIDRDGQMIDEETGLAVGVVDREKGMIYPIHSSPDEAQ